MKKVVGFALLVLFLTGCPVSEQAPSIEKQPPTNPPAVVSSAETPAQKVETAVAKPEAPADKGGGKSLKLDGTETNDADLAKIVKENPDLVELTLGGTKITDFGISHLTRLSKLKKLRLSKTGITDFGTDPLADIKSLEDLDLSQTAIGDATLACLAGLPNLKRLNLYLTKVSDKGCDVFAKFESASKLTWLNIDKCPLGDKAIAKLSPLVHLEWLHLGGTALTDVGLVELTKIKTLKEAIVTKTETTQAAIDKFKASLPECKVRDNISEKVSEADIAEAAAYRKSFKEK